MADSILELAAEAASSTLFIFCFFNLIILIILFTSLPVSSTSFDQQKDDDGDVMPFSIVIHSNTNTTEQNFMLQKDPIIVDVCEVTQSQNETERCMNFNCNDNVEQSDYDHEDEDECNDHVEQSDDDHKDEDEDEDDFRQRVEEFIDKVNRGWREERQRTSRSVE